MTISIRKPSLWAWDFFQHFFLFLFHQGGETPIWPSIPFLYYSNGPETVFSSRKVVREQQSIVKWAYGVSGLIALQAVMVVKWGTVFYGSFMGLKGFWELFETCQTWQLFCFLGERWCKWCVGVLIVGGKSSTGTCSMMIDARSTDSLPWSFERRHRSITKHAQFGGATCSGAALRIFVNFCITLFINQLQFSNWFKATDACCFFVVLFLRSNARGQRMCSSTLCRWWSAYWLCLWWVEGVLSLAKTKPQSENFRTNTLS